MAKTIVVTCDYLVRNQPCGAEATTDFTGSMDKSSLSAQYCATHTESVWEDLRKMGVVATRIQSKNRKSRRAYSATNGRPFSTQEAREWLTASGYPVKAKGRIPNELLEIYAKAN